MKRILIGLVGAVLFSSEASAFNCFLTLVKDSCWTDYSVTVDLTNMMTSKSMIKATAPKGKTYIRQAFQCEADTSFDFSATFLPIIWEADKGRVYKGKVSWALPKKLTKGDTAWNITMCFPEQFTAVPAPVTSTGNCICDTTHLPAVPVPDKA